MNPCASANAYSATCNPIPGHPSTQDLGLVNASLLPPPECARRGGHPRGPGCPTVPDIAFSSLLFLSSFLFALALKHVKTSHFFPSVVSVPSLSVEENWPLALGPVCEWERVQKEGIAGRSLTERPLCGQVRKVLSDFSSVLAILLGCGLDAVLGLATPKLTVPREFKVRAGSVAQREKGGQQTGPGRRMYASHHSPPLSFRLLAHKIEVVIMASLSCEG